MMIISNNAIKIRHEKIYAYKLIYSYNQSMYKVRIYLWHIVIVLCYIMYADQSPLTGNKIQEFVTVSYHYILNT